MALSILLTGRVMIIVGMREVHVGFEYGAVIVFHDFFGDGKFYGIYDRVRLRVYT